MNVQIETIGFDQFYKYLGKLSDKAYSIIEKETFKMASGFRNKIIKEMRNTPKNYGGVGNTVRQERGEKYHYPSWPGNFPAIDSGRLIGSIIVSKEQNGVMLGSIQRDPPYPYYLDLRKTVRLRRPWLNEPVKSWLPGANLEARIFDALRKDL